MSRLVLLADHQDTWSVLFDDASNQSFDVVKTVATSIAARTITRVHSGQTLATESNLASVGWNRAQSGELLASCSTVLGDGSLPTWS